MLENEPPKRVKSQEIEHTTSLVVELDREFNISYYTTLFENGEVNRADVKIPTYLPESQEPFLIID